MESPMLKFQWKLQESKKLWSKLSAASGSGGGHVLFLCICILIFVAAYLYLYIFICVFFYVFFCWKRVKSCDKTSLAVCHRWQTLLKGKLPDIRQKHHKLDWPELSKNIIFWIFIESESCFIQWNGLFSFGLWNLFEFEKSLFCCWFSFI